MLFEKICQLLKNKKGKVMAKLSIRMAMLLIISGSAYIQASTVTLDDTSCCKTNCYTSRNTYLPRAFSSYSMHEVLHNENLVSLNHEKEDHQAYFAFTMEYMQNFGAKCGSCRSNLGALPFWSGTNSMTIGNNDGRADVDAYQFGLGDVKVDADGIAGRVFLCPKVQQIGSDFMFYYTYANNRPSMYFKFHAPLGAMMIDPQLSEGPAAEPNDDLSFHQHTAAPSGTDIDFQFTKYPSPGRRYKSIVHAWIGGSGASDSIDGSSSRPLRLSKGRFSVARRTEIRMADLSFSLGYNFLVKDNGFLSAGFKFTCPTGNAPRNDFALEPIFGRGGAWGVGGEVSGYYKLWQHCRNDSKYLDMTVQGEVLHLVPGKKINYRSFDLKQNGPGSKYLIVQHYQDVYFKNSSNIMEQISSPGALEQVINITTLPVISKIGVEGSLAALFKYHHDNWSVGLGGEVWGRSQEKLSIDIYSATVLRLADLNHYAVLGRQLSAYSIDGQAADLNTYYCEPLARINKSQDPVILVGTPPTVTAPATLPDGIADARISTNRIPATFDDALDICGAQAPSVVTGKLFAELEHTWKNCHYAPSIGIVGGIEFANNNSVPWMWSAGLQGHLRF